jgi:hypothetical protein
MGMRERGGKEGAKGVKRRKRGLEEGRRGVRCAGRVLQGVRVARWIGFGGVRQEGTRWASVGCARVCQWEGEREGGLQ